MYPTIGTETVTIRDENGRIIDRQPLMRLTYQPTDADPFDPYTYYDEENDQ